MRISLPSLLVVSLILVTPRRPLKPLMPSGHWEGTITPPDGQGMIVPHGPVEERQG